MAFREKDDIRYQPVYTPIDICRYAHVLPATLRNWSTGRGGNVLLKKAGRGIARFSFMNLIEAHVLLALRKTHRVPMQRVRRAKRWLAKKFDMQHPFAEVNLETDGRDVFVDYLGENVSASEAGQIGIPKVMNMYLQRIERDVAGPVRFFPFTRGGLSYDTVCPKLIAMDPKVEFGRPVVRGTRIETVMILDRYSGGESLSDLAQDYDLDIVAVEEALRCEIDRHAA